MYLHLKLNFRIKKWNVKGIVLFSIFSLLEKRPISRDFTHPTCYLTILRLFHALLDMVPQIILITRNLSSCTTSFAIKSLLASYRPLTAGMNISQLKHPKTLGSSLSSLIAEKGGAMCRFPRLGLSPAETVVVVQPLPPIQRALRSC